MFQVSMEFRVKDVLVEGRLGVGRGCVCVGGSFLGNLSNVLFPSCYFISLSSPRWRAGSCIGWPQQGLALVLADPVVKVIWIELMVWE